jgi:hypothetical protein
MCLSSLRSASREDEALTLGQLLHDGIYLMLQEFYLALSQMGRGIERRLCLVGGQIGAEVEEVVLDANHHLVFVALFWQPRCKQAQV